MSTTIYLNPNQVPAQLTAGYNGKKFRARICERVVIPSHAGLWDGGSRDTFRVVRLADGAAIPGSDNMSAPWDNKRQDRVVILEPGIAVIEHSIFCGKDAGLTIYALATDLAPMLPAPVELTDNERLVLSATHGFKSSYMGKDRYQMMRDQVNPCWAPASERKPFPTREQWDAAKASLIARGYLNKAGAITTAGRNAL